MKLPQQITMTQFLHVMQGYDGLPRFTLFTSDVSADIAGYACLGQVEFAVDVPQVDHVAKMIDSLGRKIEEERAESQQRINALLDRISKLQCLEHKPEENA